MKRLGSVVLICSLICGAFMVVGVTSAQAAKHTLSFANGMAPTHAVNETFKDFVKKIEARTNGDITGVLYPNNQLGSDIVALQAVQDHSLALTWTTTANVLPIVPEMAIFDIPFFFPNAEAANLALADERFMGPIQERYKKVGFYNFGMDALGYRWMSSNKGKRINKLEDLKAFKLRTMENPYHVAFWRALGAAPTPLANSERYTALQQGTVDGQENVMENAFNTKMYEVQDIFYNTKHIVYVAVFVADPDWIAGLPENYRKILMEEVQSWRKTAVAMSIARENDLLKELETKYGKTVVRDMGDEEFKKWQAVARPVAEDMVRKKLGNELVDLLYQVTSQKK